MALLTQESSATVDKLEADPLPEPWVVNSQVPLFVLTVALHGAVTTQAPLPKNALAANTWLNPENAVDRFEPDVNPDVF